MNVLSCFDGISAGRLALQRAGIEVGMYYRSEVDKYTDKVAMHHFPNDIQLGDVTKWREWDIDWSSIDMLIGGSPCQGFSFAGKQAGTIAMVGEQMEIVTSREKYLELKARKEKLESISFLSESYLFWEYVLILDHIRLHNPDVKFLLENVKMKKELLEMIDTAVGVKSVVINSALLSAQNRVRHYWCNWEVTQPEDKGILLKDVLEHGDTADREKSLVITTRVAGSTTKRYPEEQRLEVREYGETNCLTTVQKDNLAVYKEPLYPEATKENQINEAKFIEYSGINETAMKNGKSYCLTANCGGAWAKHSATKKVRTMAAVGFTQDTDVMTSHNQIKYRKLTPTECARLQTFPDGWCESVVSNSQSYKAYGNSWTVDVIAHIFSLLK